jgi:glycosyltransferase involved in cell wall biosynthesis
LKIFEAMAMGKAVVSTSVGAEGLPVQHDENIILADEPEDFARRVASLMKDTEARARLGSSARRLVEQRYSWASAAAHFEGVLAEVTQKASQGFTGVSKA